jgi:hypothetical protein
MSLLLLFNRNGVYVNDTRVINKDARAFGFRDEIFQTGEAAQNTFEAARYKNYTSAAGAAAPKVAKINKGFSFNG